MRSTPVGPAKRGRSVTHRRCSSRWRQPSPATRTRLYFGGGTPSLLEASRIARVVELARRRFGLIPGAEITVEANPRDLDQAGYAGLVGLGATRLSLGVQSFDDAVLSEMGRHHTAADSRRAVREARRAGFANLSLDLILGWPGESRERFSRALDELVSLAPDHVSLYLLELDGKTVLSHRKRLGQLSLPEDDLVAELYDETVERLAKSGLARYEISNFARCGYESRHNAKYWDDAPFLGFGMAAHSYREGLRYWNHDRFASYCRAVEADGGQRARAGERRPSPRERAAEALFTGLRRREGIRLADVRARYGIDPLVEWRDGLGSVQRAGLLRVKDDQLQLTERGMLLSNEVFALLV